MKSQTLLLATLSAVAAQNPDGFTFNLHTETMQGKGFAVARKETQNSFNADGLKRCISFALANNVQCVGGWYDHESGLYYFDATEIFDDKEQTEQAARDNEQLAYFDLNNLEEIRM